MSAWLLRRWYSPHPVWFLIPLSWLFWLLSGLRRGAYALGVFPVARLPAPVIVAGNITVGGTGKTPFVIWLAEALKARGFKPGVVTRGYGAALNHARIISPDMDARETGDEALLLARHGGLPVAAGSDRVAAARLLVGDGADVLISDDGLQHYRLPRRCEIVLLDGGRGLGNRWLLPAGPLRERAARLRGVQVIIKQVPAGSFTWPQALSMRLKADTAVSLDGGERKPLSAFAGQSVHAVAGIGNPEQFFATLRAAGLAVDGRALPDHAQPTPSDLEFGDMLPVFMTEKDAVKCAGMALPRHWYLEAAAEFDAADAARLLDDITRKLKG